MKILFRICFWFTAGLMILDIIAISMNGQADARGLADQIIETNGQFLEENEGKLILVTGTPQVQENCWSYDDVLDLRVDDVIWYQRLARQKVYIKGETTTSNSSDKDSDDNSKTRVTVSAEWINAQDDREDEVSHGSKTWENPKVSKLPERQNYSEKFYLQLEELYVSQDLVEDFITTSSRYLSEEELLHGCAFLDDEYEVVRNVNGEYMITNGDDVGDIRIYGTCKFLEEAEEITMLGIQQEDVITAYEHKHISGPFIVRGRLSKEEMVDRLVEKEAQEQKENTKAAIIMTPLLILFYLAGKKDKKKAY